MIGALLARLSQGYRTLKYPEETPPLSGRYRGLPQLDGTRCPRLHGMQRRVSYGRDHPQRGKARLDLGRLFCAVMRCRLPEHALTFSWNTAWRSGSDGLVPTPGPFRTRPHWNPACAGFWEVACLREVMPAVQRLRSDTNVRSTIPTTSPGSAFSLWRRPHADGLLVTGPVTRNMKPP